MKTRVIIISLLAFLLMSLPVAAQSGVFCFNAFNGVVPSPAEGATIFFAWKELNPAPGVYAWGGLDSQLQQHANNGTPVAFTVTVSRTGYKGDEMYLQDWPDFAGPARRVPYAGKTIVLPPYDDKDWKEALFTFIRALGRRYDKDSRVSAFFVITGVDGETHAASSSYNTYIEAALGTGYIPAFERFMKEALVVHHAAFPTMPLYCANNPGGQAFRKELILNYMIPFGIGVRNNGLTIDYASAYGTGDLWTSGGNYAIWRPAIDTRGVLPLWIESQTGVSTPESVYWATLFALHQRPVAIDLHKEWFERNPDILSFAARCMAAPDNIAWIVFRDDEYGAYFGTTVSSDSKFYLSGWPGDFEWNMSRTSAARRVWRADLPVECRDQIESRQARRFDGGTFVLTNFAALGDKLTLRVSYLDTNIPMSVTIAGKELRVGGSNTKRFQWVARELDAPPNWNGVVTLEGQGVLHSIQIEGTAAAGPTPTRTSTPTPTPTRTSTPSPTPTPTSTATPTPTSRPCWSPLPLSYAEVLGIRDTSVTRLFTVEGELDWIEDETLIRGVDEGLGWPLSSVFVYKGDGGRVLRCRVFALGTLVLYEQDACDVCMNWTVVLPDAATR